MNEKIIESRTIFTALLRFCIFNKFLRFLRTRIFDSHSRLKLSLLRTLHENEREIKWVYINQGFFKALEFCYLISDGEFPYTTEYYEKL